ncbi:L,D-transpeptidase family protein [Streptacidiphilus sp. EB129]|uniref:L,D-transpeptidase family protein n=1 Tax=Streptacidiphilus sp. EB129 TaxID=3156262 RepID=UPI0035171188
MRRTAAPVIAVALGAAVAATLLSGGPARATPPHFPVPVALGDARQVITVLADGTHATVTAWQGTAAGWVELFSTGEARIGSHGTTDGATRHQGTGTTPTGTYTITRGFGIGQDPGTAMPYHQVTGDDWWVEDPQSPYYNQMRTAAQGGFPLTEAGDRGSEHLVSYPTQYNNALVIDYNMNPAVPGRGAGIFLHDLGPQRGPTAGCVALPATVMTEVLLWIDPSQHPVIAIGSATRADESDGNGPLSVGGSIVREQRNPT